MVEQKLPKLAVSAPFPAIQRKDGLKNIITEQPLNKSLQTNFSSGHG
ncbi:hypothetical protein [Sphingomonas trueperi]